MANPIELKDNARARFRSNQPTTVAVINRSDKAGLVLHLRQDLETDGLGDGAHLHDVPDVVTLECNT